MIEQDDFDLVRQFLASRDEATFRELYRRVTPTLYRVAARLAWGSGARPDDIVQETWLRGVTRLPGFRFEASLRTWLVAITVNVSREMLRPRAEVIPFESLPELPDRAESDPAVIAERDLSPILSDLPEGYRTVLVLHDLEGFTHAEIALALGISAGTAKSQLSRARAAARELLTTPRADRSRRLS